MSKSLYIFTLKGCPRCDDAKKQIIKSGISYFDIDIDEYPDIWNEVVEKTKQDYVPTIFFDEHDGEGKIFVPDKDYKNIDELMKIIFENMGG